MPACLVGVGVSNRNPSDRQCRMWTAISTNHCFGEFAAFPMNVAESAQAGSLVARHDISELPGDLVETRLRGGTGGGQRRDDVDASERRATACRWFPDSPGVSGFPPPGAYRVADSLSTPPSPKGQE
jgi:hypothetical protein